MNLIKYILPFYIVIAFVNLSSCTIHAEDDQAHSEPEKVNQPSTHEDPSLENEHEDAVDINLTNQQILNAGIELTEVSQGLLTESRRIYGEIHLNAEQVVHKYPQYPGIIRDVRVNIGDSVTKGDTLAVIFNTGTLSLYPVISSQDGEILEKHAVVGEYSDGSEPIVIVGNLNTVWVDLHAFEKDREILKKGQPITLYSTNGNQSIKTQIRYIKPIMNAETRTNIVRCVVDNTSRIWNPGRLVFADVEYHRDNTTTLVVPQDCVQIYESDDIVFIPEGPNVFEMIKVKIGRRSKGFVEILSGVAAGDQLVSTGAFFLKSEMVTSSLSGHAGHGH